MASAVTSPTFICNLALDLISDETVVNVEEPTSDIEETCNRHYSAIRQALLRDYTWNFAKATAILTPSGDVTPEFEYSYAFKLPNDFLRFRSAGSNESVTTLRGLTIDYDIVNGYIYANADSLRLKYIKDETVVVKFDSLFVELFQHKLAIRLAYALTSDKSRIEQLKKDLEIIEARATSVDSQERPPKRVQQSVWLQKRQTLSSPRVGVPDWKYHQ